MNKMASLTLVTQGVKGGNKKEHGQQGLVKVFVGIDKSISFDAFQGAGPSYERRNDTQIVIRNNGFVFSGTLEELVDKIMQEPDKYSWPYSTEDGDFELSLTSQDILDCSHGGSCDADCERVAAKPYILEQLKNVSNEAMLSALDQMGVEVEDENNRKDIIETLIWDAACCLRSDLNNDGNWEKHLNH